MLPTRMTGRGVSFLGAGGTDHCRKRTKNARNSPGGAGMAKRKNGASPNQRQPPSKDQQPVAPQQDKHRVFQPGHDLPPLRLEWRHPAELDDNPANWRRHPDAQFSALSDVLSAV